MYCCIGTWINPYSLSFFTGTAAGVSDRSAPFHVSLDPKHWDGTLVSWKKERNELKSVSVIITNQPLLLID